MSAGARKAATRAGDVKEGFEYYKSSFEQSDDPIVKAVKNVGESLGKAAEGLRDTLRDKFGNK